MRLTWGWVLQEVIVLQWLPGGSGGRTRARTWDPMIKSLRLSDFHSEAADCRIGQDFELREEWISHTP